MSPLSKVDSLRDIAVGTGTWGIAAVIPKYLSLRLPWTHHLEGLEGKKICLSLM